MSKKLQIGLVAEGPTDYEVIQAALKAMLQNPFVMTQLQPEATQPQLGTGWCGILKWCQQAQQRHNDSLDTDPTLFNFDLLIIHVDVDVATKEYADCSKEIKTLAQNIPFGILPCNQPCPPVGDTVNALIPVIESWLQPVTLGDQTILCLPAQSTGTWLAVAVLPPNHQFLVDGECDLKLEEKLKGLPKAQRIKKTVREYRSHASTLTEQWEQVKQVCTQAQAFEDRVLETIYTISP